MLEIRETYNFEDATNQIGHRKCYRFGIKASILTGAVYYTIDQGLWEDTDKADKVYAELYQAVAPYIKEVPVEVPELPSVSDFAASSKLYYNQGVVATSNFLRNLPSNSVSLACEAKSALSSLLEATTSEAPPAEATATKSS